ncbi:hypothetical protein QZH41_008680 [Actinostola sp. cb2023]|nr:hypothetical protein QZH41_008680 [Actinostola sp. cb2023]
MKKRKQLKEDVDDSKKTIEELTNELREKEREIRAKDAKLRRLNDKVDSLVVETEELDSIRSDLSFEEDKEKGQFLPSRAINERKKKPTGEQSLKGAGTTGRKRRRETWNAAKEINGGEEGGRFGLVDTVDKLVKTEEIINIIEKAKCKNLKQQVFPKLYKKYLVEYEKSDANMVRSVATYYSNGVMGKKKIPLHL